VAGIVLTIMVATTGGIVAASPAQAAEGCYNTSPHSMEVIGTGAYASVIGTCRSSDMSVHGWLQDSACDSKSAKITVRVYYSGVTGSQLLWQNSVTHGGGCNTGRSYSFSGAGEDGGGADRPGKQLHGGGESTFLAGILCPMWAMRRWPKSAG
jgi:hypothetical protein